MVVICSSDNHSGIKISNYKQLGLGYDWFGGTG